jgi:hypothetical protein
MCQRESAEKTKKEERDYWFNHSRPMPKQSKCAGKQLSKEENGNNGDSSGEEKVEVTSAKGDSTRDRVPVT